MCRTRVLCGIVMLVDEVDTEEMQNQAAKNVVGECSVLKSATCLITNNEYFITSPAKYSQTLPYSLHLSVSLTKLSIMLDVFKNCA